MQKIFDLLHRRIWLGPLILLIALGVGLGLGLLIGWVVLPVSWTPSGDDVQIVADSYALNNDIALARQRLGNLPAADQARLFKKIIADSTARNRLIEADRATALAQALRIPLDSNTTPSNTPGTTPAPPPSSSLNLVLIGGAAVMLLAILAVGGFVAFRVVLPRMRAPRPEAPRAAAETPQEIQSVETAPPSRAASESSDGTLGSFVATYNAGMDNFDSSFPLETQRQGFLGECGIGVSETVGDGLPDKVTAFDLWLFDKTDVRTVTQILMSDYAFNDPGVRAKLQTKGDAVRVARDQTIALETHSLRIQAHVQDLAYASNPSLPPSSYFQKLAVEIKAHFKE